MMEIERVTAEAVVAMCEEYDVPLLDLPGLWDKARHLDEENRRLITVERKTGILNGNMERELQRLRQFSHEQANIIKDMTAELQEWSQKYDRAIQSAENNCSSLMRANDRICELEEQRDELQDKFQSAVMRSKHYERLHQERDPARIDDLEDLVAHYRCGINGAKELADNKHFSNELRLHLIRKVLYVFEPELKKDGASE